MMNEQKRVVVTGMGIMTPIGDNLDDYVAGLYASHADYLDTLAAAQAATGHFEHALDTAGKALKVPGFSPEWAEAILARRKLYEAGRPYQTPGRDRKWESIPRGAATQPPR